MDHRRHWVLDPDVTFLNHGSFGACPVPVQAAQARLRTRMERQPVQFFVRDLQRLLDQARQVVGEFLGADPAELAFVPNATTGVNSVLRSLRLQPGDELLITDHAYNACRNALDFAARSTGACVAVAHIPFPLESEAVVLERVMSKVGKRTRLALLDHVTSQTGLVLPIQALIAELTSHGVETLIDGAHAPGMLDLDLGTLGATYYTGNFHKWVCAPKGAGFLWVRRDRQPEIRPVTISHGANAPSGGRSRFHLEFDWMGTDDPTAYLALPDAIGFLGGLLEGGWPELRASNRAKALEGRRILCQALGVSEPAPPGMIGSMAAVPLPDGSPEPPSSPLYADPLQDELLGRFSIEVPIVPWPAPPKRLVRISAQAYNRVEDYERLAVALKALI